MNRDAACTTLYMCFNHVLLSVGIKIKVSYVVWQYVNNKIYCYVTEEEPFLTTLSATENNSLFIQSDHWVIVLSLHSLLICSLNDNKSFTF